MASPSSCRLDDENSGQTWGIEGAHRRGGSEEAVCVGRDVTGRGGWSVPPLPLELRPGEHPGVTLTLGEEQCQEGGRGKGQPGGRVCRSSSEVMLEHERAGMEGHGRRDGVQGSSGSLPPACTAGSLTLNHCPPQPRLPGASCWWPAATRRARWTEAQRWEGQAAWAA